jgi:putative NADH-flavin reductase
MKQWVNLYCERSTAESRLITQALDAGHEVTAFARNPEKIKETHNHLTKVAGDVLNPASVDAAIPGHDAVLVVLGAGRKWGCASEWYAKYY